MSCEPNTKRPWYCETHYMLPLYPDGKCNHGRDEMAKNGIHEIPTPRSEFTPLPFPTSERPSHVRFATSAADREAAVAKLRAMREGFPAIFKAFELESVLTTLEQEG